MSESNQLCVTHGGLSKQISLKYSKRHFFFRMILRESGITVLITFLGTADHSHDGPEPQLLLVRG
jgi:hypothetical protein